MTPPGYPISFAALLPGWQVFAMGVAVTLSLWAICLIFGTLGGLLLGGLRLSRYRLLRAPAALIFELFRDTPVLVQLVWFYYVFPIVAGVHIPAYHAAVLGLSLNTAAYLSEIVRAGVGAVGKAQWDAARALGFPLSALICRIILPQAFNHMIPALANRAIELGKVTSLASVISVHELMYGTRLLSALAYRPFECFTIAALLYLVLISPAAIVAARLERHARVYAG